MTAWERFKSWFSGLFVKGRKIKSSFKPYAKEQFHDSTVLDLLNHAFTYRGCYGEILASQDSKITNHEELKRYIKDAMDNPVYGRTFGPGADQRDELHGEKRARGLGSGDMADLIANKYIEDKKKMILYKSNGVII